MSPPLPFHFTRTADLLMPLAHCACLPTALSFSFNLFRMHHSSLVLPTPEALSLLHLHKFVHPCPPEGRLRPLLFCRLTPFEIAKPAVHVKRTAVGVLQGVGWHKRMRASRKPVVVETVQGASNQHFKTLQTNIATE